MIGYLSSSAMNLVRGSLQRLAGLVASAVVFLIVLSACTITPGADDWVSEGKHRLGTAFSARDGWRLTPVDAALIAGNEADEHIRGRHYIAVAHDLSRTAASGAYFYGWADEVRRKSNIDFGVVGQSEQVRFFKTPTHCPDTTMRLLDEQTLTLAEATDLDPWLGQGESIRFVVCWYLAGSGIDEGPYTLYLRAYGDPKGWLTFDLGFGPEES